MKIVAVLEVMWADYGDPPLRWFRINPYNRSGQRLISIVGHRNFTVTNSCPDVVYSAASRGIPSKSWLRANLKALAPDVVLVCGRVAAATFEADMCPGARVVPMMHPAARAWSKAALASAQRKVTNAIKGAAK